MYKGLLELIKLIFGPKALSKTIGTRTNVIQLPNNKTKRYIKEDLNIEAASDAAAMNAKKEMEELVAEIPKMNDAERLIFEGNLRRLKNRLGIRSETDPTADVFQFGTKEKVTPGGIASLTEKAGQKSPPGTLMGNIESRIKQLEASGEDLSTMKGQTLDEIMGDVMQTQKTMSKMQDEGLVRAAVRYKMMDDLKRGTLKLPKNLEDVVRGASNEEEVITIFRNNYGEDALEQVDSLIPDFYKMTSPADAVKKIEKDFPNMKPRKIETKQTMDLDEAAKAEQENILTPGKAISADSPEGKKITEALIGKPKAEVVSLPTAEKILSDMRNLGPIDAMKEANKVLKKEGPYKNLTDKDIEKIMDDINDHIFGGDLPVDPEDFATGGRVGFMDGGSKGLDYLMGIERQGYANGDYVVQAGIKNYLGKQKTATVPIKWKSGKDHPDTELAYITKPEKELLIKLDLHGSMKDGKPNKGPGGIISLNSGGSGNGGSGGGGSGGGGSGDTGDMGSEAANVSTSSGAASVGAGDSGVTDTADLGSEAANNAATAAAAASVGMGTFSPYSRPGMIATNISNYMRGNPATSIGLTALGAMMGMPGLGVMNAVNSVYGGGSLGSSTGSGQGEDGSGDGGDGRTPISSFDIALLTPDLSDSYNLAKNRDYRLYQGANNPFYSMQAVPSGGIKNVYTEFKKGGRVGFALGGGFGSVPVDPMEAMYVNTFGFNPFPKYGFNSYMDYNTARITGTPMNQNISDLEDYLGTLESAREINLPGVTKDLSAEDISRLQEEYVKKMAKTSNALNPTVTASTSTSTPDYRQQALSEMLSRYNVSSLGDIKNFNYLIPGYKDKNNLQVRAFETRIPDLAVSRRAQQLEDAAIRAQQDQEAYKNRISQVDPNALRNSYLQNLQNTSSQSINQFQSQLRSNLVPRENQPQGLDYLTGL
jgi:hypothetical protein